MRGFALFSASILASIALSAPAVAEGALDLSPLACAWGKLPDAEQTRLREEFKLGGVPIRMVYRASDNPYAKS